jgi:hypothetical protein
MATATASCRQLIYFGFFAPRAAASAKASQTGGHSEPGEDKIKSTPLRSIAFNIACPPCMRFSFIIVVEGVGQKPRFRCAASELRMSSRNPNRISNPKQFQNSKPSRAEPV